MYMIYLQMTRREKAKEKWDKMNLGLFSFHGTVLTFQIFVNLKLLPNLKKKSFINKIILKEAHSEEKSRL